MKTNYHTHHLLCSHAKGNVEDYVLEAIKCGFDIIGISDHGPINADAFYRMNLDDFYNTYLIELENAITKYKDKILIKKGLEIEYIEGDENHYKKLLEDLDYLILGPHYYEAYRELHPYGTYGINTHDQLERYTQYIEKALDTKFFKILAHPDLFIYGYYKLDSFGESCVKRIAEAAIRNNVILEFNAGGIRTNKRFDDEGRPEYNVPNDQFWKIIETTNAKVIVGSDCHLPEELDDEGFKSAKELVKKYNLNLVETI